MWPLSAHGRGGRRRSSTIGRWDGSGSWCAMKAGRAWEAGSQVPFSQLSVGWPAGERFGDALKARRLSAGISEVRVATAISARLSEVRAWERGDRLPDPNAVRALIRLLQVDSAVALDWLDLTGIDQEISGDGRGGAILLLSGDSPADPFGG